MPSGDKQPHDVGRPAAADHALSSPHLPPRLPERLLSIAPTGDGDLTAPPAPATPPQAHGGSPPLPPPADGPPSAPPPPADGPPSAPPPPADGPPSAPPPPADEPPSPPPQQEDPSAPLPIPPQPVHAAASTPPQQQTMLAHPMDPPQTRTLLPPDEELYVPPSDMSMQTWSETPSAPPLDHVPPLPHTMYPPPSYVDGAEPMPVPPHMGGTPYSALSGGQGDQPQYPHPGSPPQYPNYASPPQYQQQHPPQHPPQHTAQYPPQHLPHPGSPPQYGYPSGFSPHTYAGSPPQYGHVAGHQQYVPPSQAHHESSYQAGTFPPSPPSSISSGSVSESGGPEKTAQPSSYYAPVGYFKDLLSEIQMVPEDDIENAEHAQGRLVILKLKLNELQSKRQSYWARLGINAGVAVPTAVLTLGASLIVQGPTAVHQRNRLKQIQAQMRLVIMQINRLRDEFGHFAGWHAAEAMATIQQNVFQHGIKRSDMPGGL